MAAGSVAAGDRTADNLRVGLIGLGTVCEYVHYPGFSRIPGVEIAGLCEVDGDLLARRQAQWGVAAGFTEVDRFLASVRPDAVTVAVPNVYHRDIVLKCVEAGCHVLCEKPIGMTVAETVDMYDAARSAGVRHMTAFTYRFVPGMRYLKHLVDAGDLGEIRHARFQRLQDWGEHSVGWRQYRRMAATGEAIGRDEEGRLIFVADAIPGETVEVEIVHEAPRRWRGLLRRVLAASPDRIEALCPHFGPSHPITSADGGLLNSSWRSAGCAGCRSATGGGRRRTGAGCARLSTPDRAC